MIPDIEKIILLSLGSIKKQLNVGKGYFELLGYDFIIDDNNDSWLIEVNTNPCLE